MKKIIFFLCLLLPPILSIASNEKKDAFIERCISGSPEDLKLLEMITYWQGNTDKKKCLDIYDGLLEETNLEIIPGDHQDIKKPVHEKISDLSILEYIPHFEEVYIQWQAVKDASVFRHFNSLTTLNLYNNKIEDISFVKDLHKIQNLQLGYNNIEDISSLKDITLTSLGLEHNDISDVTSLKHIKNLKILSIGGNYIENYSPITQKKYLARLEIQGAKKQLNLNLKCMKNLSHLSLDKNNFSNLDGVVFPKNLETLSLNSNKLKNLNKLLSLRKLTNLSMENNLVEDFSPLRKLSLQRLATHKNPLRACSPKNAKELEAGKKC